MSTVHHPIVLPDAPAAERARLDAGGVACWEQAITIDTYEPAEPDRYPLFLDRRVYQGSSGKVYPIPFTDRILPERRPREWRAIHLENRWVRLVLLPELGGRIHIGYDKTRDYDFFYRNNVIKPALVGLAGPWISGGVEFNWPQHHRPATYLPVETHLERHEDGSVTAWHGDLDPLQRMRASHGIRLRGDSSLIELEARLVNRTDVPQTFLWWANVAARSHDRYQSFFPTDVRYVADHARRAITAFPRADRPYYGVDYPALGAARAGADRIDLSGNVRVPTSYMVTDTVDDFFGGYDHDERAGFVHWADRAIAPGKKMWTWGNGEVGHAWDRHLTDGDGPYVELMAGVFTDNQPDFTWLRPGETRSFRQYWYPIQDIGPAVQATLDAAVGLEVDGLGASVGVAATAEHADVRIELRRGAAVLGAWSAAIGPGRPFTATIELDEPATRDDLVLVVEGDGRELVRWSARPAASGEPWVATEPPAPAEIASSDELVVTGRHLAQYRHPTRAAEPYFAEAVRRDAGDARARLGLARLAYDRGEPEAALEHLEAALARETRRNLNPEHADVQLLRALVLERLGRFAEAADAFGKAVWDGALALPALLGRARLALRAGDARRSLEFAEQASRTDASSTQAVAARVVALRALGRDADAGSLLSLARAADPLDPLLAALADDLDPVDPRTLLTMAHELHRLGDRPRGIRLAERAAGTSPGRFGNPAPLASYALAAFLDEADEPGRAAAARTAARAAEVRLAFPAGLDDLDALRAALAAEPGDARAAGLLGCWLLDAGRTADALVALERSIAGGADDPVVWRNAAVALVNTGGDLDVADERYARALDLAGGQDARLVYERDQLASIRGLDAPTRIAGIEAAGPEALVRDDLAVEYAGLLVDTGRAADALDLLDRRTFQPFEGGEGRVIAVFDRASAAVAGDLLRTDPRAARDLLAAGVAVPERLGEGRHPAEVVAERFVLLGDAEAALGDRPAAEAAWRRACDVDGPLAATGHTVSARDAWIGTAHLRLGEPEEAERVWAALEARAAELEASADRVDYFATSLPELLLFPVDTAERRAAEARELRELADAGRRSMEAAA
ncbi:DUF5107 domain-containing protein [Agromyces sp. CFH 90414]|uniref:DUF5107 domain-containing protein n=1 Tax=Agromyces agglutinans TaxID=2662258 RepID=A0A6I2FBJ3_9MICO|nr:DUF5107 domain-containing protein [Agromyces agglutinans]MRG61187.1 DUF5107 domain-containing protein [Agromyces agglutinans]